jgi:hypothetical protein
MKREEVIKIINKELNKIYSGCKKQIGLYHDINEHIRRQYCGNLKVYLLPCSRSKNKLNNRGEPYIKGKGKIGFNYRKKILCYKCNNMAKPLEKIIKKIKEYKH